MYRRIAVRAVVVHEGKLLCVRLKPNDVFPERDQYWCTPGGGLESEEGLLQGLEREIVEETAIKPAIGKLLYIQQYKDKLQEYLEFFFEVTNASDYLTVDLSKTTHGGIEIAEIQFIDPTTSNLLPKFLQEVSLKDDIRLGVTRYYDNF